MSRPYYPGRGTASGRSAAGRSAVQTTVSSLRWPKRSRCRPSTSWTRSSVSASGASARQGEDAVADLDDAGSAGDRRRGGARPRWRTRPGGRGGTRAAWRSAPGVGGHVGAGGERSRHGGDATRGSLRRSLCVRQDGAMEVLSSRVLLRPRTRPVAGVLRRPCSGLAVDREFGTAGASGRRLLPRQRAAGGVRAVGPSRGPALALWLQVRDVAAEHAAPGGRRGDGHPAAPARSVGTRRDVDRGPGRRPDRAGRGPRRPPAPPRPR